MSRLGAVAVAVGALSLACGGGDSGTAAPSGPSPSMPDSVTDETAEGPENVSSDAEWGLAFSIEGRTSPMTARAELRIVEGEDPVYVAITGRTSGTDVMMIELRYDGLEDALGAHSEQFSLPDSGAHVANGSLDGNWYYSQGGTIDLSVDRDGNIAGTFDIALARGDMSALDEAVVFQATDEVIPLDGEFSGSWVLNCHSHLAGHGVLIVGGEYCDNLEF
jgi:hypothetical protein